MNVDTLTQDAVTIADISTAPHVPVGDADQDLALVRRVASKDRQAFEALFRRFYPRVCQFAVRMLHQQDLAEEVAGDTMFVVWRKAASFQGKSKTSTWIFGIAHRLSCKALDKRRRHAANLSPDAVPQVADEHPLNDPAQVSADRSAQGALRRALDQLSTDHQATLQFVRLGYGYADIAQIMNCPVNTVKTRVFHARAAVKQALEGA